VLGKPLGGEVTSGLGDLRVIRGAVTV